jgi:dsDNA-specific endonuclease/ATPase MutS2
MKTNPKFNYDIQVDLHGYRAEDAERKVKSLLSSRRGLSIMIIHGRGNGVLRKIVREQVQNCKHLKGHHFGEDLNIPGSDGVTIIYT